MAALLALVLVGVVVSLPPMMGKSKASSSARELFGKSRGVNLLAAARIFLFGARDVWFVVGVPVFLYANGWTFTMVGGFMALWTIFYGLMQASAPAFIRRSADGLSRRGSRRAAVVGAARARAGAHHRRTRRQHGRSARPHSRRGPCRVRRGLRHQFLRPLLPDPRLCGIGEGGGGRGLLLCRQCRGPLHGTLLSGLLYQWGGLTACLAGSALMLAACFATTLLLPLSRED